MGLLPILGATAEWAVRLVQVVAAARTDIGSKDVCHLTSDKVLAFLTPGMEASNVAHVGIA